MKMHKNNRNMLLVATLLSVAAAGVVAGLDLAPAPARSSTDVTEPAPVRVVGTPFIPNTNPRER